MKVLLRIFCLALSCLNLAMYPAQVCADNTVDDFQSWLQVIVQKPIGSEKRYVLSMEVQPRLGDDSSYPERILVRPSIGYKLSPRLSLWLGHAWTPTFLTQAYEKDFRDEHRLWQQLLYTHPIEGTEFTLEHRARLEQRFIENTGGEAVRLRYLLRGSHPFQTSGKTGLTAYNEYFVNFNAVENGPKAGFDRNRFFVGPYFSDGSNRYEFGYLGELGNRFRDGDRMIHAVLLSAVFRLE